MQHVSGLQFIFELHQSLMYGKWDVCSDQLCLKIKKKKENFKFHPCIRSRTTAFFPSHFRTENDSRLKSDHQHTELNNDLNKCNSETPAIKCRCQHNYYGVALNLIFKYCEVLKDVG